MKYWRGYIAAALSAALTWALMSFSKAHGVLVDMIYPYVTRLIQTALAGWASGVDFCLWQILAVLLVVLFIATIVLMIIFHWNPVQWLGWVLAAVCGLFLLHTGMYGLNQYAGDLADDIRMPTQTEEFLVSEMAESTAYFRDIANELAAQVPRKEDGSLDYPAFEELAVLAADGFEKLKYEKTYSVFAGSTDPVKKLGWADMYTAMGITGMHMPLTGEAAVNPQTPVVAIPFTMCHEMSHRVCIARERDANFGGFLACDANESPLFRYSGYFMAFRYCYNALIAEGSSAAIAAAQEIYQGVGELFMRDLTDYREFYAEHQKEGASELANAANDAYLKGSGDEEGTGSYSQVSDLLVNWYTQEIYLPAHKDEELEFNPLDKDQIDLTTQDTVISPSQPEE